MVPCVSCVLKRAHSARWRNNAVSQDLKDSCRTGARSPHRSEIPEILDPRKHTHTHAHTHTHTHSLSFMKSWPHATRHDVLSPSLLDDALIHEVVSNLKSCCARRRQCEAAHSLSSGFHDGSRAIKASRVCSRNIP